MLLKFSIIHYSKSFFFTYYSLEWSNLTCFVFQIAVLEVQRYSTLVTWITSRYCFSVRLIIETQCIIFIISKWIVLLFIKGQPPIILELFFMLWGSYYSSRNYSSIMCSSLYVAIYTYDNHLCTILYYCLHTYCILVCTYFHFVY